MQHKRATDRPPARPSNNVQEWVVLKEKPAKNGSMKNQVNEE